MRLGFIFGTLFGTWLTLTYPDEMSNAFNKFKDVVVEFMPDSSSSVTEEKKEKDTGMIAPE
jgi:hypothetical protein